MNSPQSNSQLSLKPLGAGDLIDRAVRFYRKNYATFLLIASPPIVLGTLCLVGWMFLARSLFQVSAARPDEAYVYQFFVWSGGILIWFVQLVAVMVVMGGAARNFVRHLLFGEAITFRETYRNVKKRFAGLTVVSVILIAVLAVVALVVFYIWATVLILGISLIALALQSLPVIAFILALVFGIFVSLGALWIFFLVVSRFVYVPQVMLVEGQSAFSAVSRSATLAGRNVTRVGSLFVFSLVAIYVALMLLYLPLGFFAWTEGVDLVSFDALDTIPAWYEISYRVITQASLILIVPVLMIGLCLLYVDERVRREGYDIELMAVKRLGDMPDVPDQFINPLQPALSEQARPVYKARSASNKKNSTLGLDL